MCSKFEARNIAVSVLNYISSIEQFSDEALELCFLMVQYRSPYFPNFEDFFPKVGLHLNFGCWLYMLLLYVKGVVFKYLMV